MGTLLPKGLRLSVSLQVLTASGRTDGSVQAFSFLLLLLPAPFSTKSGASSPTGALPSPENNNNKKKKQSVCAELRVGAVPVGEEFRLHHSRQKPLVGHKGTRAGRFLLNPSLVELQTTRGKEILTCQSAYFLSRAEESASTSWLHAGAARRWKIVAALGHLRATGGLLEISLSSHPFCLVCF